MVPDPGYLTGAHALLRRHNALLIADEVPPKPGRSNPCTNPALRVTRWSYRLSFWPVARLLLCSTGF